MRIYQYCQNQCCNCVCINEYFRNTYPSIFFKMNGKMIIIFETESVYSIGQSTDNQRIHSEGNMRVMSQYACS
jgi:hypothetical protein